MSSVCCLLGDQDVIDTVGSQFTAHAQEMLRAMTAVSDVMNDQLTAGEAAEALHQLADSLYHSIMEASHAYEVVGHALVGYAGVFDPQKIVADGSCRSRHPLEEALRTRKDTLEQVEKDLALGQWEYYGRDLGDLGHPDLNVRVAFHNWERQLEGQITGHKTWIRHTEEEIERLLAVFDTARRSVQDAGRTADAVIGGAFMGPLPERDHSAPTDKPWQTGQPNPSDSDPSGPGGQHRPPIDPSGPGNQPPHRGPTGADDQRSPVIIPPLPGAGPDEQPGQLPGTPTLEEVLADARLGHLDDQQWAFLIAWAARVDDPDQARLAVGFFNELPPDQLAVLTEQEAARFHQSIADRSAAHEQYRLAGGELSEEEWALSAQQSFEERMAALSQLLGAASRCEEPLLVSDHAERLADLFLDNPGPWTGPLSVLIGNGQYATAFVLTIADRVRQYVIGADYPGAWQTGYPEGLSTSLLHQTPTVSVMTMLQHHPEAAQAFLEQVESVPLAD